MGKFLLKYILGCFSQLYHKCIFDLLLHKLVLLMEFMDVVK